MQSTDEVIKALTASRNRYKRLYHELLDKVERLENQRIPTFEPEPSVIKAKNGKWDYAFGVYLKKEGDRVRIPAHLVTGVNFHAVAYRFGYTIRIKTLINGDKIIRRYS